MPTSDQRHPSRDACLRDALNQLREQRGVSLEKFGRVLNGVAHGLCPSKTSDMPCLSSFTTVSDDYDNALMSWNKRVQRWSNGSVEFPSWLEEPWVMALEELGDTDTRMALVNRHGLIGIRLPTPRSSQSSSHELVGELAQSLGSIVTLMAQMLEDGLLDETDAALARMLMPVINKSLADLLTSQMIVRREVFGETVQ